MLRRTAIIFMAVTAILVASAGTIGYVIPVWCQVPIDTHDRIVPHFYDGRFRVFWFHSTQDPIRIERDEQFRNRDTLRTFRPDGTPVEPSWIERLARSPNLIAVRRDALCRPLDADIEGPDPPNCSWQAMVRVGNRRSTADFGYAWDRGLYSVEQIADFQLHRRRWLPPVPIPTASVRLSYVRMPVWLPTALLLILPLRAAFRAIRHRRRRMNNECVDCGYNLTGLPSPRCPECGASIFG